MPSQLAPCGSALSTPSLVVLRRLRERGVVLEAQPGAEGESQEGRIETALMALFRDEGDEGAFAALYEFTRARLLAWITSLTGSKRGAPDPLEILQDAYVNIYRYARSFRDEEPRSFRVWSRTIVGNLVRRARQGPRTRSLDAFPEGGEEPADPRVDPADALVRAEDEHAAVGAWTIVLLQYAAAYEHLSARDRRALELIEVQGLSYAEAGGHLGVGLSNMKMIMFRSRRRIRAMMAKNFESRIATRVPA